MVKLQGSGVGRGRNRPAVVHAVQTAGVARGVVGLNLARDPGGVVGIRYVVGERVPSRHVACVHLHVPGDVRLEARSEGVVVYPGSYEGKKPVGVVRPGGVFDLSLVGPPVETSAFVVPDGKVREAVYLSVVEKVDGTFHVEHEARVPGVRVADSELGAVYVSLGVVHGVVRKGPGAAHVLAADGRSVLAPALARGILDVAHRTRAVGPFPVPDLESGVEDALLAPQGKALAHARHPGVSVSFPALAHGHRGLAFVGVLQHYVHDSRDGVGAVLGGRTVPENLDSLDGAERDGVHVHSRGAPSHRGVHVHQGAFVAPLAVYQHQHLVRPESPEGRRAKRVGPVAYGRTRKVERRYELLNDPPNLGLSRRQHLLFGYDVHGNGGIGNAPFLETASQNHELLKLLRLGPRAEENQNGQKNKSSRNTSPHDSILLDQNTPRRSPPRSA